MFVVSFLEIWALVLKKKKSTLFPLCVLWPSVTAAWAVFVQYRQADTMSWISIVVFSSCSFVLFPLFFK